MGDGMENRDWYLIPLVFNTLTLLLQNQLWLNAKFIKMTLKAGIYNELKILQYAILILMIIQSTLYIIVSIRKKAGNFEDTLAKLIISISLYNFISVFMMHIYSTGG